MIPSVADALDDPTQDFERLRMDLEARFTKLGHFEECLKSEQTGWNDQTNPVVRVIALHNVEG